MWADALRDGGPAEYRWHPVQRRKVWLTPSIRMLCSNAAKTRKPLTLAGVPQTTGPISAAMAEVHHIVGTYGGDIAA